MAGKRWTPLAALAAALAGPVLLSAQDAPATSPGYTLDWWTVDGGGATGGGGTGYSLQGTAGQPDAALWQGGRYTLAGGFWVPRQYRVYLPLLTR